MRIDDWGVSRLDAAGDEHGVAWRDLVAVSVVSMGSRAFDQAFYLILHAVDGHACVVPGGLANEHALLDRLERLPRFDPAALRRAAALGEGAEERCWQGQPGEGLAAIGE